MLGGTHEDNKSNVDSLNSFKAEGDWLLQIVVTISLILSLNSGT